MVEMAIALTRRVLDDVDVPLLEKAILIVLAFSARGEDGSGCFPKVKTLARYVGCDERSIRRGLDRLRTRGYVTRIDKSRAHRPAEWCVTIPIEASTVDGTADRRSGLERTDSPVRVDRQSGPERTDDPVYTKTVKNNSQTVDIARVASPRNAALILADSAQALPAIISVPENKSSLSQPSSTDGEVSTSAAFAKLSPRERFESIQRAHETERRRRGSRFRIA